ncbi:MAG: chemotaxis protein CheB [Isosphaeraceae bacterium]|nr:chemotaxis protein CheB [Isosphaeraceae bacterium]
MDERSPEDPPCRVIALAASAGGLSAILTVLSALPANLPAALILVQHLDPHHPSLMAEILGRRIHLPTKQAEDGERLRPGWVYIAPPDWHLTIAAGHLALSQSQPVNFVRPSADLLFRSVAESCRERAIAVVLTGSGQDGARGIQAIKRMGGTTIAQDRATSAYFGMPGAAIRTGCIDYVLPLDEIPRKLLALIRSEGDVA